jgi:hypothetical protein
MLLLIPLSLPLIFIWLLIYVLADSKHDDWGPRVKTRWDDLDEPDHFY